MIDPTEVAFNGNNEIILRGFGVKKIPINMRINLRTAKLIAELLKFIPDPDYFLEREEEK